MDEKEINDSPTVENDENMEPAFTLDDAQVKIARLEYKLNYLERCIEEIGKVYVDQSDAIALLTKWVHR